MTLSTRPPNRSPSSRRTTYNPRERRRARRNGDWWGQGAPRDQGHVLRCSHGIPFVEACGGACKELPSLRGVESVGVGHKGHGPSLSATKLVNSNKERRKRVSSRRHPSRIGGRTMRYSRGMCEKKRNAAGRFIFNPAFPMSFTLTRILLRA